jgi:hypothetical protein
VQASQHFCIEIKKVNHTNLYGCAGVGWMSWEDQGRQYHEWFGHGTAPVKLKPIVEKDGATTEHDLETRLRTVVHGVIGALPSKLRE